MAKRPGSAAGRRKTARNAERRKRAKKDARAVLGLPVLWADTAGIDIGATEIYVAVAADRDEEPVRCFGGFTEDLRSIAEWLKQCGMERIAMESTGRKKDRRGRLSVAAVPALGRAVAEFLPACTGDLRSKDAVTLPGGRGRFPCSADSA